jgi:DNA-binding MarR family transcriptional regulator
MMSSGGMTNRIDRLEQAHWVVRESNPQDRRGTLVRLTEKGREQVEAVLTQHIDNERQLLASLDAEEQQQLNVLLKKLLAGLPPQ